MSHRTSRILSAGFAGLLLVLTLASCGRGGLAADAGGGIAARVGSETIAVDELGSYVDQILANEQFAQQVGKRREEFQRAMLTRLVQRLLVRAAAAEVGAQVGQEQLDARLQGFVEQSGGREQLESRAAQSGFAPSDLDEEIRNGLLLDAIGEAILTEDQVPQAEIEKAYRASPKYDQVHVQHILVADKKLADQILAQIRAGGDFAALAKRFSTDTSNKDKGGDLGFQGRGQFVPEFEKAMFAARPGSLVGPVRTQFGFHVIKVVERRTTSLEKAAPELRAQLVGQQRQQRVQQRLTELAKQTNIEVNPRFGRWDAERGQVVEDRDPLSTPAPGDGSGPASPGPGGNQPGEGEPDGHDHPGEGGPGGPELPGE